jgi:hypothetical protein
MERNGGLMLFAGWTWLAAVSILVALDPFFGHSADIVAWCAFASDFSLGIAGVALVTKWFRVRSKLPLMMPIVRQKTAAETFAGLGFMSHGQSSPDTILFLL